eukprot:CAMPEP_0178413588 /NCGR_PEP_ID=MMETSP0689_2-20121128/22604_1 /TAXON_ID=160604 /ORGANISM="Amphidinium massartii, Strain CS-259" /LENGTH=706 /DNA_ID=CAMNT_0020034863 /DNA_START=73 /DNA_END=2189 /DNA_ORIENTATION=-
MPRVDELADDFEIAQERLCTTGYASGIQSIVWDEDTAEDGVSDVLKVTVAGIPGEFSAFLPENYPDDETSVYGPPDGDLHISVPGRVETVLRKLLAALERAKKPPEPAPCAPAPAAVPLEEVKEVCSAKDDAVADKDGDKEDDEFEYEEDDDEDFSAACHPDLQEWAFETTPMETSLKKDIDSYANLYGSGAISSTQLSTDVWRVRMYIYLTSIDGMEGLLDESTAKVWGIHHDKPLLLDVHVPVRGYMTAGSSISIAKIVQHDYADFNVGKQILQILGDFCSAALGRQSVALDLNEEFLGPEEMEQLKRYSEKKKRMLQKAAVAAKADFFVQLSEYTKARIGTLHEFCSICDAPFARAPMVMRSVCNRALCVHAFLEFGSLMTTAHGVHSRAEIADLLLSIFFRACNSSRASLILDPYPLVYGGRDGKKRVFDPQKQDLPRLQALVQTMVKERATLLEATRSRNPKLPPEAMGVMNWVISSNRCFIAPLEDEDLIRDFGTNFQYVLVSAPPDRERQFQDLKAKHGSFFAFHGSTVENWHSILRNGLKNASATKLQMSGAKYGNGIYLAADSLTSMHYAAPRDPKGLIPQINVYTTERVAPPPSKKARTEARLLNELETLCMMAVCEVIKHPSVAYHHERSIMVAPEEQTVITRFFLVYTDMKQIAGQNVRMNATVEASIRSLMQKLGVGLTARKPSSGAAGAERG